MHEQSTAKIGIQLAHAGRKAGHTPPWDGETPIAGWDVVGPSAIPFDAHSLTPRELSPAELRELCAAFVRSTELAAAADFDLIELHAAHGYLLGSFLSPLSNRRSDEYGGSLNRRLRFPLEVLTAVRSVWTDKPLFVRISATDWVAGGTTPADAVTIARALHEAGADLIDVSGGGTVPEGRPDTGRLFQAELADRIRNETGIPVMAVGGIRSWDDANTLLAAGRADLCALAREHLFDPYFTRHAAVEQKAPLPWPKPYGMARNTMLLRRS